MGTGYGFRFGAPESRNDEKILLILDAFFSTLRGKIIRELLTAEVGI